MATYPEPPMALGGGSDDLRLDGDLPVAPLVKSDAEVLDGALYARAAEVLAVHRLGPDGWCTGCLEFGVLTFHPCSVASWAVRVEQDEEYRRREQRGNPSAPDRLASGGDG